MFVTKPILERVLIVSGVDITSFPDSLQSKKKLSVAGEEFPTFKNDQLLFPSIPSISRYSRVY